MTIEPYTAVGIQNTLLNVREKEDVFDNLQQIREILEGNHYLQVEYPIKLVTIAEGAIQTFVDSQLDWDHETNAREGVMDTTVPGPETDYLAELAVEHNCYLCGQLRAKDPELGFEDRYFNILFVIDPSGEIILKYRKLQTFAPESSVVPHDVWDEFKRKVGDSLEDLFPVVDTEIGRIGCMECMDTSFPEIARGLAMNGAEILYAPTYIEPYVSRGWQKIQMPARALDNNCYVISPNTGDWYLYPDSKSPTEIHGGQSMIIDYTGQILACHEGNGHAAVSAPINIEELRYWRTNASFGTWLKDLRTEQYQPIYEEEIMPKNRLMDGPPGEREERMQLEEDIINRLIEEEKYARSNLEDDS